MAKKFKGKLIPTVFDEIDYEGFQTAHCNSTSSDFCDGKDCKKCIFDSSNIEKYKEWRNQHRVNVEEACRQHGVDLLTMKPNKSS